MKNLKDLINEGLINESNTSKKVLSALKSIPEYKNLKGNCEIWVQPYSSRDGGVFTVFKYQAKDKLEALKIACESLETYVYGEDLEIKGKNFEYDGETVSFEEMLDNILDANGDGCDYIYYFKFKNEDLIDELDDPWTIIDYIDEESYECIQL